MDKKKKWSMTDWSVFSGLSGLFVIVIGVFADKFIAKLSTTAWIVFGSITGVLILIAILLRLIAIRKEKQRLIRETIEQNPDLTSSRDE